ncbi:LysR family transcriptional regulator [Vibrio maritimus]|uniref:LysR family transcriptional regulator n=1 Tax=Vibrio maritimus TaxID=990268 RepID=UPI00406922B7
MKQLDLNLLKAFVVTYNEKKLRRAAAKLNITPPALSVKISKLNQYFEETLFVKTPDGFMPTPFSDELFAGVNELLAGIEMQVSQMGKFAPKDLNETIKIAIGRHQIPWLAPKLYRRVRQLAPNCNLIIDACGSVHVSDLLTTDIDLIVDLETPVDKSVSGFEVGTHEWEFVVRKQHPLEGIVPIEKAIEYEVGLIHDSTLPHGVSAKFFNEMVSAGTPAKIGICTPSFAAMLEILLTMDVICPMFKPSFWAHQDKLKAISIEPNEFLPTFPIFAYMHKKNRYSRKHLWLVEVIKQELDY